MTNGELYALQPRFTRLFSGLTEAFGTGEGRWVKRSPRPEDFLKHLRGEGPGIGIAPLRPDNTVLFAAIDLDEPDFAAAREMQQYIPGASWIERSRSGNAHVWVFFAEPLAAWVAMGVLKGAVEAAGKEHVEVFPKNHDFAMVRLGNYINLPYHGDSRPIEVVDANDGIPFILSLSDFLDDAEVYLNDPKDWENRANWLLISAPDRRERTQEFGTQTSLHICAEHILSGDAGRVTEGHRSIVYFNLAKMLTNCSMYDHDEVVELLQGVNEASKPDSIPDSELLRILSNAERGQFTSTGCDDPIFVPYAHPDCKIAHPGGK
jgi:hypothetical protein